MKRYIKADSYEEQEEIFAVYHVSNFPFSGFDFNKLNDLGLHCSFKKPRKNKSNVTVIYIDAINSRLKTVIDANYWTTLDGFIAIIESLDSEANSKEITKIYRELKNGFSTQGPEISKALSEYIINTYNVDALKYKDTEDNVGDWCLCILNPDIIVSYESLQNFRNSSSEFEQYKTELLNSEYGIDDDTEEARYFNNMIDEVASSCEIQLEGSTQANQGVMVIYDTNDVKLAEFDYQEWLDEMENIIMKSNNLSEYRKYLQKEFISY